MTRKGGGGGDEGKVHHPHDHNEDEDEDEDRDRPMGPDGARSTTPSRARCELPLASCNHSMESVGCVFAARFHRLHRALFGKAWWDLACTAVLP